MTPYDNTRTTEGMLSKVTEFVDEHDSQEDAQTEAVRVLRELRKSDSEHGWHAGCHRQTTLEGLAVSTGERVIIRLNDDD